MCDEVIQRDYGEEIRKEPIPVRFYKGAKETNISIEHKKEWDLIPVTRKQAKVICSHTYCRAQAFCVYLLGHTGACSACDCCCKLIVIILS